MAQHFRCPSVSCRYSYSVDVADSDGFMHLLKKLCFKTSNGIWKIRTWPTKRWKQRRFGKLRFRKPPEASSTVVLIKFLPYSGATAQTRSAALWGVSGSYGQAPAQQGTSTVYWCIASKLKAPWNFYWMSNMFLWVEIFLFFVCYHVVPKRHSQLDYELNGL